ncbi:electron transport complex protein RnfG [Fontimonas thermophila]|uniref:Ion-translocating oxidoreductase complex subunit G n=1 Tax=Fontimonas thermophila TaxID=1076937 RepID=A0A1I2IIY8_9GAMM|nr:electron transport complex subunit RsxG [Fontimonas thermophila]SFF42265.1 electron transport complex protein RnfG [Fontimonas thermophila]
MSTLTQMTRSGLVLAAFAAIAATLLASTYALTADRIRAAEQQRLLRQLEAVLPAGAYDNDVASDIIRRPIAELRADAPVTIYRARRGGTPVAAVLTVTAPDGYGGPIELLVGIGADGRLTGVRVTAHQETPGLGDKIEIDRSDWIRAFTGRSLTDPPPPRWAVRKDGGVFDQFTGATITPRAVIKAVRQALEYFEHHRADIFATADAMP